MENPLPKPRVRQDIHHDPHFYAVRNHLVDFLVSRSKLIAQGELAADYDPLHPPVVRPVVEALKIAA
ncbi:MAG TPA: hypothetical protein ENO09_08445 [bacterium]|nr:hypothetical protein [bacterium]